MTRGGARQGAGRKPSSRKSVLENQRGIKGVDKGNSQCCVHHTGRGRG